MKIKRILFIIIIMIFAFNIKVNAAEQETTQEKSIDYNTHVQNIGWQNWKKNGEMAGTSGMSYRLEGIHIKLKGYENLNVKYQVHVQGIGWQDWKKNGEMAGTSGRGLRLEAIRIVLDSSDDYSVMYKTHVQGIGWQDWKSDGEMAGTSGQSLRLEAIQIKIVPKIVKGKINIETPKDNSVLYKNTNEISVKGWKIANIPNTEMKAYIDSTEVDKNLISKSVRDDIFNNQVGYGTKEQNPMPGFEFKCNISNLEEGKHTVKVELFSSENLTEPIVQKKISFNIDRGLHVRYSSHVQNIGWQNSKTDGEISGTSGYGYRVEAMKINLINNDANSAIEYQTHVQNIGWQSWKTDGEVAGTSGLGYRVEAIKIKLKNLDDYSVMYRTHIQNVGWQDWRYDGELSGTEGRGLRIEAIQIKIVKKVKRGILNIESPQMNADISSKTINVSGWSMSNDLEDYLKIKVNGNLADTSINRYYRNDVLGTTGGYGSYESNPKAGFNSIVNLNGYEDGPIKITVELYSKEGNKLKSIDKTIILDTTMRIEYQTHVQGIGWQSWVKNDAIAGTTGQGLRVEAIKIKAKNMPENYQIKYQAHIEGIGWQNLKNDGEIAGTIGEARRIEAIQIKLLDKSTGKEVNNMTVEYQAHVEGIGWQNSKVDGEIAGTTGQGLRIEALKIKLVNKKLPRGIIRIEKPTKTVFTGSSIRVYGYEMSTQSANSKLKLYMNNRLINFNVIRNKRDDIVASNTFYGNKAVNPTPGFEFDINFSDFAEGGYTLRADLYSEDGSRLLDTTSKTIYIVKNKYWGIDVSKWQGDINWTRVKQEGTNYAIIRIGYGQTLTNKDKFFEANYNSCKANGIPIGVYLYSYALNTYEASLEADACLNWLNGRNLQLPVFWDTEADCQKGIDRDTLTAMADTFCSKIEANGYQAGIYGSKSWLTNKLNMSALDYKYDVWVAHYGVSETSYQRRYDIWQYSSEGTLSGISGKIDCNWFYKKY